MLACLKAKKTFFTENGGLLLEELIAFSNGRSNPIRHFSTEELQRATNNYDRNRIFLEDAFYQLFKGSVEGRPIFVKKYTDRSWSRFAALPYICKDIAIGSHMSVHKNVLKVLGCCLETEQPAVVYEFGGSKDLQTCISAINVEPLPWKFRLKIAADLANAVAYLHTAFRRPVIHRDIKSLQVILDQNNVPKLIDFGLCICIPEGQSHVEDALAGTTGFVAPEYVATGYITEKVDVYMFGMLLLELFIGGKPSVCIFEYIGVDNMNHDELSDVIDSRIMNEGIEQEQLLDFKTLLLKCISFVDVKRPTMIEVAKELRKIYHSFLSPC